MLHPSNVSLSGGEVLRRYKLNEKYTLSLTTDNLIRNYLFQSGLWSFSGSSSTTIDLQEFIEDPESWHWGWEGVTSQIRGHFLGHWLSAASQIVSMNNNEELNGKILRLLSLLEQCQKQNKNGWLAAIPEQFMEKMKNGEDVWAPHYTVHKILMGLISVYNNLKYPQALKMADLFSDWFLKWSDDIPENLFSDILEYETGGMLEVWADLYAITKNEKYNTLMKRYTRHSFFDGLLNGLDVLTNKHANTQVVEILGAQRVWEVTGNKYYKNVVEKFWNEVVNIRGYYITGGVSCGELWTPPGEHSSRLGEAQEHCVIYNMIRLASKRYCDTGDACYADFIERNVYNGIFAQQHPYSGAVSYFLGIGNGSQKRWGSPTKHFWCCHGTLLQAQASLPEWILYKGNKDWRVAQFIPFKTTVIDADTKVQLQLSIDGQNGCGMVQKSNPEGKKQIQLINKNTIPEHRPDCWIIDLNIDCDKKYHKTLLFRIPAWVTGRPTVKIDGEDHPFDHIDGHIRLTREWHNNVVHIVLPKKLTMVNMHMNPQFVGFMDGPIVLAGLTECQTLLKSDCLSKFSPDNERHHSYWNEGHYIYRNNGDTIKFVPLLQVIDQKYTLYYPLKS